MTANEELGDEDLHWGDSNQVDVGHCNNYLKIKWFTFAYHLLFKCHGKNLRIVAQHFARRFYF